MKFLDRYKENLEEEQREILEYAIAESYASQGLTLSALNEPWIDGETATRKYGIPEDSLLEYVNDGNLMTKIYDFDLLYYSLTLVEIHDLLAIIKEYEEEYSEYDDFEEFRRAYHYGEV